MKVSLIAAMDQRRVIGFNNRLPWVSLEGKNSMKADMRRFREITLKHHIIMGRKTFESIGKPLPNRINIVISKNLQYSAKGILRASSLEAALRIAKKGGESKAMIIGGESIFSLAMKYASSIYLTVILNEFEGDTFFPQISYDEWHQVEFASFPADEENLYPYQFIVLNRR